MSSKHLPPVPSPSAPKRLDGTFSSLASPNRVNTQDAQKAEATRDGTTWHKTHKRSGMLSPLITNTVYEEPYPTISLVTDADDSSMYSSPSEYSQDSASPAKYASSGTSLAIHNAEYCVPDGQPVQFMSMDDEDEDDNLGSAINNRNSVLDPDFLVLGFDGGVRSPLLSDEAARKARNRSKPLPSRPRPGAMFFAAAAKSYPFRYTPTTNPTITTSPSSTNATSYGIYIHPANQVVAHLVPHPGRGFRAPSNDHIATISERLGETLARRKGYASCRWEPSPEFTTDPETTSASQQALNAEIAFSLTQGVMTNDKDFYSDYWNTYYTAPIVDILGSFVAPKDPIMSLTGPNAEYWQETFERQISQVHIVYDEEKGLRFSLRDGRVEETEQNSRANKRLEKMDDDAKFKYTPRPIADLLYYYQVLYPGVFLMVHDPSPSSPPNSNGTKRVRIRALPPKEWLTSPYEAISLIKIVGREYYQQCVNAAFDTYGAGEDGGEWVDIDEGLF